MGIYKAVLVAFEKYKFNKIFLKNKLDNNVYLIWLKIIFLLQLCIEYNGLYLYSNPHATQLFNIWKRSWTLYFNLICMRVFFRQHWPQRGFNQDRPRSERNEKAVHGNSDFEHVPYRCLRVIVSCLGVKRTIIVKARLFKNGWKHMMMT